MFSHRSHYAVLYIAVLLAACDAHLHSPQLQMKSAQDDSTKEVRAARRRQTMMLTLASCLV